MGVVSPRLRELIIQRARGLCEYCQTSQNIVIIMQIDHIIPESAGGKTIEGNLCLACASCNAYKAAYQSGFDSESEQNVPLFNPRLQSWDEHFCWNDEGIRLIGLTDTDRATIERLKINREIVVQARQRWVRAGWHPPKL